VIDVKELSAVELDALREVASIGAGHAATALSEMTGSTIMIAVPRITIARMDDIPSEIAMGTEPVVAVHMDMLGDLTGRTLLLFPRDVALRLAALMLRRPEPARELGALEASAIKEAGNILCGAYMNALSEFLAITLLPSPPTLAIDSSAAVIASSPVFGASRDVIFAVETQFFLQDHGETLRGYFLLLPDVSSLESILGVLRI
jgi:chemotaxis protein CheC